MSRDNNALKRDMLNIKSLERHLKSEIDGIKESK